MNVKPQKLKLKWIAKHGLFKGHNFNKVLKIADLAAKEYAIKIMLEKIDSDLKGMMMQFISYKSSGSFIVAIMDEVEIQIEDIQSKVVSLESNAFAGHFIDKI